MRVAKMGCSTQSHLTACNSYQQQAGNGCKELGSISKPSATEIR